VPIQIDRAAARDLAPRLNEALELVRNEFEVLDSSRQYRNAFARLLKPDPLQRVTMLGTDQRDLFVPALRRVVTESVPRGGHILDCGAGDGQTFALVADYVPPETRISVEEPNSGYLEDHMAFLATQESLRPGVAINAGFEEIDAFAERSGQPLPEDGSIDLCLALHMLYFASDVVACVARMLRFVRPGGAIFIVVTDDSDNYTGSVLRVFIEGAGETGDSGRHLTGIAERSRLLCAQQSEHSALGDALQAPALGLTIDSVRQSSRLYGHSLADLIALSSISTLAAVNSLDRFDAAARLLRDDPESVDLRIEDRGPRKGMWSVAQPQWITIIRRTA
jgi:SAM-dependent methyltransferase